TPGWPGPTAPPQPRRNPVRWWYAAPTSCTATGDGTTPPRSPVPTTAGFVPGTWPSPTPRGSSASSIGSRTCSSPVGRTSTRPRSRTFYTHTLPSTTVRWWAYPTPPGARSVTPTSSSTTVPRSPTKNWSNTAVHAWPATRPRCSSASSPSCHATPPANSSDTVCVTALDLPRPTPPETATNGETPMPTTVDGLDELRTLAGTDLGHSSWLEITQERVDRFADATDDHQWIHVDPERAADSPFGGPIAHGHLTLSLVIPLFSQILVIEGVSVSINYGMNKVRFISPVPVGSRIRLAATVLEVTDVPGGVQLVVDNRIEVEGQDK